MSTRSSIAIQNPDGTFRAIYCHWDGYLEYVGKMLVDNYTTTEKINSLLDLGDLSAIGKNPIPYWCDDSYDDNMCRSYRARGEDNIDARTFNTVNEVIDFYDWSEFNYFFIDDNWMFSKGTDNLEFVSEYI